MKRIEWLNDREFSIDGVRFLCAFGDYSLKTDEERLILLKDREALKGYDAVFAAAPPRTMLEFGIFQGGSPTLFSLRFDLEKFVGIDLSPPVEGFETFRAKHPVGQKIYPYYGVSQTDKTRIDEIMRNEFGDTLLDVIIDDASHLYGVTRNTFEIAFPHLRPGGTYVIEDWGWAHWPQSTAFMGETSLSILVMELIMLCASRSDLISEVRVFPSFVFVQKSQVAPAMTEMRLSSLYDIRGMEILDANGLNLQGPSRGFSHRLSRYARNELRRLRGK